jgi:hypothetical protein
MKQVIEDCLLLDAILTCALTALISTRQHSYLDLCRSSGLLISWAKVNGVMGRNGFYTAFHAIMIKSS